MISGAYYRITFTGLTSLPGIGRKSANVILNVAFGKPALAVDTHVFRVARRLGLASAKSTAGVEDELKEKLPPEEWGCYASPPYCPRKGRLPGPASEMHGLYLERLLC